MIEYEKRAMIEAEDKYTFRQSTQISMQTGLIGHLRADMDTDGNGFFSSWFDFREELKTDEFKAEFDDVTTLCVRKATFFITAGRLPSTAIAHPKAVCRRNRATMAFVWIPKNMPIFCA